LGRMLVAIWWQWGKLTIFLSCLYYSQKDIKYLCKTCKVICIRPGRNMPL